MEIYSEEELKKQKVTKRRAKAAMAAVSAAALVICIVLFCTVTPQNEKACRIWAIAAASLAACFDVYVCGFVLPYVRPDSFYRSGMGKVKRVLRNLLRQALLYILCIILAAVFSTFIFDRITDTVPEKKVTVLIDVPSARSVELETLLDEDHPEGIRMVKVRSIDYDFLGFSGGTEADIYIVEAWHAEQLMENFAPLYGFLSPRDIFKVYEHDGQAYGVQVYGDMARCAASYIDYEEGKEYYLFFGKLSAHPGTDGAAAYIAQRLLMLK